ncbi:MAG: anthranilate phosphoribosyltransferase [Phycisphaerales bacterium]
MSLTAMLQQLAGGESLSESQAQEAFALVMSGQATGAQIGAMLMATAVRPGGPTVEEITGAARAMRQAAMKVEVPAGMEVIDTCGTGGDHTGTFNISTAAALIAAGTPAMADRGMAVAKHGNRSVTSKSGSSQVLEQLGVKLSPPEGPAVLTRCLREARICFCFAPAHHPAMKHAAGPRKELGFRTLFNLLGPLTNPAGAKRQVIGVYDAALTEKIAEVLKRLGTVHAMVVHGTTLGGPDVTGGGLGLDELTTTGPTRVTELKDAAITTWQLHPADLGLATATVGQLRIEGVEESAEMIRRILDGEKGPARRIAALNAAAALVVADGAKDLKQGLDLAFEAIDSGAAKRTLALLVKLTNED